VPTVGESGHGGLVLDNFFGLSGPAKMPADLVARLNAATNEVLAQPDIQKRLIELGVTTTPGTPAAFTTFVRNQVNTLQPVVKTVRVTLCRAAARRSARAGPAPTLAPEAET